jgi:hypothetical protein
MYQLEFTTAHSYGSELDGISVPVILKSGPNSVGIGKHRYWCNVLHLQE